MPGWPTFGGQVALLRHAFGTAFRFVAAEVDHLVIPAARVDLPLLWRGIAHRYSIELGIGLAHIRRSMMTVELCM